MARWRDIKSKKTSHKIQGKPSDLPISSLSLFVRFKAFIVDSFMITMPIMYFVVYVVMGSGDNFSSNKTFGWFIILLLHALVILSFLILKKETPGMRAYGLKLVHLNPKKQIKIYQIVLRYIFLILSSITFFVLLPFFRKDKKMLQDILSGTYLIIDDKSKD